MLIMNRARMRILSLLVSLHRFHKESVSNGMYDSRDTLSTPTHMAIGSTSFHPPKPTASYIAD